MYLIFFYYLSFKPFTFYIVDIINLMCFCSFIFIVIFLLLYFICSIIAYYLHNSIIIFDPFVHLNWPKSSMMLYRVVTELVNLIFMTKQLLISDSERFVANHQDYDGGVKIVIIVLVAIFFTFILILLVDSAYSFINDNLAVFRLLLLIIIINIVFI